MNMKRLFKIIAVVLLFAAMNAMQSCESCTRGMKSIRSDFDGGLERNAILMDYNGNVIKRWDGKFDIRDSGSDNQIFFDIDGKRVWIQGGIFLSEEK